MFLLAVKIDVSIGGKNRCVLAFLGTVSAKS
jgi:hypothetical protein